jgi:hypothetical protein
MAAGAPADAMCILRAASPLHHQVEATAAALEDACPAGDLVVSGRVVGNVGMCGTAVTLGAASASIYAQPQYVQQPAAS